MQRGAFEAHVEAHRAADAAFWLVLHALGTGEPVVGVVVGIDDGHAMFLGKTDVLLLAQCVFLQRMDVGLQKKIV